MGLSNKYVDIELIDGVLHSVYKKDVVIDLEAFQDLQA